MPHRLTMQLGWFDLAGLLDYVGLSIAAKTYWMMQNRVPLTMDKITEQAQTFQWPLSTAQAEAARAFLEKLNLAKTGPASDNAVLKGH